MKLSYLLSTNYPQSSLRVTLGIVVSALLLYATPLVAQEQEPFRVMFWNVENLFDTQHDSLKNDREFLPHALRRWHYGRYKKKLTDIARVITAVGEWSPPAVVGLCEVENDSVLRDLTRYSPLKEQGYRYVLTQSGDARGIDVALLYQRDRFKLLSHRSIVVPPLHRHSRPTRDILHVTGVILTGDTLDLFVCHFPSRSGGTKQSEPYRLLAAAQLKAAADSIMSLRMDAKLLIMGDLNDYPTNKSIAQVLGAVPPPAHPQENRLYHLLARKAKQRDTGSYKYQGHWELLDHLIVSGTLLRPSSSIFTDESKADIARFPFLLTEDSKYGGVQPLRTYYGMQYQGGYSDHLPVYVDFVTKIP